VKEWFIYLEAVTMVVFGYNVTGFYVVLVSQLS